MSYVIARIADGTDEDGDPARVIINILSVDNGALIFADKHMAEDFLDMADIDVEMYIIETPEGVTGVEVV